MKGLERINVDTVAVGDYVQGVRSRLLYRVISAKVNEVTIQRVDDPENVQTLIKLALYNKFRVAEAPVAVEPVEETVEPEEVAKEVTQVTEKEKEFLIAMTQGDYADTLAGEPTFYFDIPTNYNESTKKGVAGSLVKKGLVSITRFEDGDVIAYTPAGIELAQSLLAQPEPKQNKKTKITNEQYLAIAEVLLKEQYKTKKELAKKYGVDTATISDILNPKYCRKSCREAVEELKIKYGYTR